MAPTALARLPDDPRARRYEQKRAPATPPVATSSIAMKRLRLDRGAERTDHVIPPSSGWRLPVKMAPTGQRWHLPVRMAPAGQDWHLPVKMAPATPHQLFPSFVRDERHQDLMRRVASGPARAAPSQNATSATTICDPATAAFAPTWMGRKAMTRRATQRTADTPMRTTPITVTRLCRLGHRFVCSAHGFPATRHR